MSTFKVERTRIANIRIHDNADKLELASVENKTWQFVIRKGEFKNGDECIFFPVDSVLPQPLIEHLGIGNMMAGKEKNRIKTVKLRGYFSQGFVCSIDIIQKFLQKAATYTTYDVSVSCDIYIAVPTDGDILTKALGVEKYDPPAIISNNAILKKLPHFVESYDIEGCDNFPNIVEMLMDQPVYISEKLEGMNFGVSVDETGEVIVNQRNFSIYSKVSEGNALAGEDFQPPAFIKVAHSEGLVDKVSRLQREKYPNQTVTIRGEFLGPSSQANFYNLKEQTVRVFDIKVNGSYLPVDEFLAIVKEYDLKAVPCLSLGKTLREWLDGKTVREMSDGKSLMADKPREGVVIKPMVESQVDGFGRLFIKQRGPEYLAKTDF